MSGLSALKFVTSKPHQGNSPKHARRQKLSSKIHEQIQMAKALQSGSDFVPVKLRAVKDQATGQTRKVEIAQALEAMVVDKVKTARCALLFDMVLARLKWSKVRMLLRLKT
jgi:Rps23 Pro-64 3,4-dihydroxylase Tpa1-like proline 4-hydroxylase